MKEREVVDGWIAVQIVRWTVEREQEWVPVPTTVGHVTSNPIRPPYRSLDNCSTTTTLCHSSPPLDRELLKFGPGNSDLITNMRMIESQYVSENAVHRRKAVIWGILDHWRMLEVSSRPGIASFRLLSS